MKISFWQILIWIFVFILGSLIVSFLIYPSSFQSFKNNIKNMFPENNNLTFEGNSNSYQEINMTSYLGVDRCSILELSAEQNGLSKNEYKLQLCTLYCGEENLSYGYYSCDDIDRFHCFCEII